VRLALFVAALKSPEFKPRARKIYAVAFFFLNQSALIAV